MPGTNYNARFNNEVKVVFTDDNGHATHAECVGNPNVVAVFGGEFVPGCEMLRTDFNVGDNLYQNNGTLASPVWNIVGSGSGTIGGTIQATEVGYGSALNTLTSDSGFTRDLVTHQTLVETGPTGGFFAGNLFGAGAQFYVSATAQKITSRAQEFQIEGVGGGGIMMNANTLNHIVKIGDVNSAFNSTLLVVDDLNSEVNIKGVGGNTWFTTRVLTHSIGLGDIDAAFNSTRIFVVDSSRAIQAITDGFFAVKDTTGNFFLNVDMTNSLYELGDITNSVNGTSLSLDDSAQTYTLNKLGGVGTRMVVAGATGILSTQLIVSGTGIIGQTSGVISNPAPGGTFETWVGQLAGGGGASIVATTFIGYGAGNNATGADLASFVGEGAGSGATNATGATFFGAAAGLNATGAFNTTAMGLMAGQNATNASESIFFGGNAGNASTNANQATFIGASAGAGATNARHSIFIGFQAGLNDTVDNTANGTSIIIGDLGLTGGFKNSVGIGAGVINTAANQFLVNSVSSPFTEIALNSTTGTFRTGDTGGVGNSTVFTVVDIRKGFNFSNLQNFANNAAAIVGGLVIGDIYYTNTAGDGILKIVI